MENQVERLKVEHISKTFPGTKALVDVSLSVMSGEVRALVGENGAGKSTLMNIIGIQGKVPFILTGKRLISISPQMRLRLVLGLCIRN